MGRLTSRQKGAVDDYVSEQSATMKKRQEASQGLATLNETQSDLRTAKATVQKKLAHARELLSELNAQEKARLAAIEQEKRQEAARKAAELAQQQAAAEQAAHGGATQESAPSTSAAPDSSYATKAAKALAFARAQVGKPYVWGATGPGSYDCSGLTQAVWKAVGVSLPRVTYGQADSKHHGLPGRRPAR